MFDTTAGDVRVIASAPATGLAQKGTPMTVEFRSAADGALVDVRDVRVEGAMSMPGMNMAARIRTERIDAGRYRATGEFGMAGAWRFTIAWVDGGTPGSVRFERTVQ